MDRRIGQLLRMLLVTLYHLQLLIDLISFYSCKFTSIRFTTKSNVFVTSPTLTVSVAEPAASALISPFLTEITPGLDDFRLIALGSTTLFSLLI